MQVRRPIQAPGARWCRLCFKSAESVAISWLGVAEQVRFSTQLSFKDTFLWDAAWSRTHRWVPPQWYSPTKPIVGWRTSLLRCARFADHEEVSCSRVDAWSINCKTKPVITVKMSCLRINNREKKSEEKTVKYAPPHPLHWELKQQFLGYEVRQRNIIIDAHGGWSWEVYQIVGGRRKEVPKRMQKLWLERWLSVFSDNFYKKN